MPNGKRRGLQSVPAAIFQDDLSPVRVGPRAVELPPSRRLLHNAPLCPRSVGCGIHFARQACMAFITQVSQYARGRLVRRLSRSMPWIGAVVAIAAIGTAIRRKGLLGGALDTALDVTPVVGAMKNAFEAIRGRDFIKDKRVAR
jgi:hypothetical protein